LEQGRCVIDDDMQPLYPQLLEAHAVIVGSPVYFGSVSALCKAFLERVQGFGIREKRLRLKVGGAMATGGSRNGGQESVLAAIHLWCHINDMIPVGITAPVTQWGVTANTGFDPNDINKDTFNLKLVDRSMSPKNIAWLYGRKIATVTHIIQAGIRASGLDLPDAPYGFGPAPEFPPELESLGAVGED
jgi:multimeric flavodoxin WrbA